MLNIEFLPILLDNLGLYILDLCLIALLFFVITKKLLISIINPLTTGFIAIVFADTVPLFLYQLGLMPWHRFHFIIACELSFWICFFLFKKKSYSFYYIKNEKRILKKFFNICFGSVILYYGCLYSIAGAGLFMSNRFDMYEGHSLLQLLSKFILLPNLFCHLYAYHMFHLKKKKKAVLIFTILSVLSFLSGAKSSIIILLTSYFLYRHFYLSEEIKIPKWIFVVIPIFPILTIIIGQGSNGIEAFGELAFRFVKFGDVYWMSMTDNTLDELVVKSPVRYILNPFLKLFNLGEEHREAFGNLILAELHPGYEGVQGGPNARCPVTSYILFQDYGFVFAGICGLFASFLAFGIRRYIPDGLIGTAIYGMFYTLCLQPATDPLGMWQILLILCFEIYIIRLIFLVFYKVKIVKNEHENINCSCCV